MAHYPTHGATLEAVYQRADQALYYAKNHGRNAVAAADDLVRGGCAHPALKTDSAAATCLARRRAFRLFEQRAAELPSSALGPIKASRPAAGVSTPSATMPARAPAASLHAHVRLAERALHV